MAVMIVLGLAGALVLEREPVPPAAASSSSEAASPGLTRPEAVRREAGSESASSKAAEAPAVPEFPEAPVGPELPEAAPGAAGAGAGGALVALDPGGHRRGGCVALEPSGSPRATVVLDAGHGAPDPGAAGRLPGGRRVEEKDVTLPVAVLAARELRSRGVRAVLTRSLPALGARLGPGDLADGVLTNAGLLEQLSARARCANLADADALVSVHLNAFDDPTVRGAETLFDPNRTFSARSRVLAGALHRSILDGFAEAGRPTLDRGLLGGSGSGLSNEDLTLFAPPSDRVPEPSLMPGVLVEPLFITHGQDAGYAVGAGRAVLATAIADGVEQYLDATRS